MNHGLAAKAFIVDEKGKLLLVKRSRKNSLKVGAWELPGGRLNPGENPFDGLKREVLEETGLGITIAEPLSIRHFKRDEKQRITMLVFLCSPNSQNLESVRLSSEHDAFEWISLENAKEKITDFFYKEIEDYKKKLFLKK